MSGDKEDGEGMEPPKSVEDGDRGGPDEGEQPLDGFTIVDSASDSVGDDEASADDAPDTQADLDAEADAEADADLLSVEQWLAEAEISLSSDTDSSDNSDGTASTADEEAVDEAAPADKTADPTDEDAGSTAEGTGSDDGDRGEGDEATGESMSDIMAELLAAAEESEDSRTDEPSTDDDKAGDQAVATDTDTDTDTDTKAETETDAEVEAEMPAGAHAASEPETETETAGDADKSADAEAAPDDETSSESKDIGLKTDTGSEKNTASEKNAPSEKETASSKEPTPEKDPAETEVKTSGMVTAVATPPAEKSRSLPIGKLLVAAVVGTYLLLTAAWGVDMARHRNEAMRGVQLVDIDVGGSNREALDTTVDGLTDDLGERSLEIVVGEVTIESDPVSLGARLDGDRMVDEALQARRGGVFFLRPVVWLGRLFSTENIEARYIVDADAAVAAADDVISPALDEPVEPTLELRGTEMTVSPGSPGVSIETREIVGRLPGVVEGGEPYRLQLAAKDAKPALETSVVAELAEEINKQTAQPIMIQVLDDEAEVSPRTQKSWIDLVVDDGDASWAVDEDRALEDLKPLFPTLGSEDQLAKFSVVDEKPIIIPASESVVCCDIGSSDDLQRIIERRIPAPITEEDESGEEVEVQPLRTITLAPVITDKDEGVAELESLGIIEQVSTFTTEHKCCQNRVKNIQRFADLMQGVIVRPGEELSLNGFVGQRTREKGFVADGAIALGNFEQQVGGGISQYATTFFNASFFAGVEFLEYQSHSIYISRYPRGREATISWRRPDLKIRNNTDYGILIWNDYTDTSITVSFYSTKHLDVEALPLKRSSDRKCRIDITPRVITFPDGTQTEDSVRALYRPGEGLDCNGNSTTPEDDPKPEPTPEPEPEPAANTGGGDEGEPEVLPPAE